MHRRRRFTGSGRNAAELPRARLQLRLGRRVGPPRTRTIVKVPPHRSTSGSRATPFRPSPASRSAARRRGERVVDRVHQRRDRAERAGLADAFDPEWVALGRVGFLPSSKGQKSPARGIA